MAVRVLRRRRLPDQCRPSPGPAGGRSIRTAGRAAAGRDVRRCGTTLSPGRAAVRMAASASATTTAMPMPQLNTRSISAGATPPVRGQPGEHRRHRPGGSSTATMSVRQHARQVARQPAAGDVRRRLQQPRPMQRQQRLHVDPGRRHQRLAERHRPGRRAPARPRQARSPPPPAAPARSRWNARRNWPGRAPCRPAPTPFGSSAPALRRAHREAGQVVVAVAVHARHLGGLAADQGAAGLAAALGDAGDHVARLSQVAACRWRNSRGRTAARRPAPPGR